jgi:cobalt/nickel transport system permease protein
MWAVSAGTIIYCSRKVRAQADDRSVPLMGVLGAFIFTAQMVNFTIPFTGSSGHLGGGLLLAIILGPHAAFLTIASVLMIQALLFADGGLLALGCNIFNLGFFPAFIAYPLVYRKIISCGPTTATITTASLLAAVSGLQLGALAVVLETISSGISSLPFTSFIALMQPIHLVIGVGEGLVTASIVSFIHKARPEIIQIVRDARPVAHHSMRTPVLIFLALSLITGGVVSQFASNKPDGLEWSISRITGHEELNNPAQGLHGMLNTVQELTAFLPNYSFKNAAPHSSPGASVAGLTGATITLTLVFLVGLVLRRISRSSGAQG